MFLLKQYGLVQLFVMFESAEKAQYYPIVHSPNNLFRTL